MLSELKYNYGSQDPSDHYNYVPVSSNEARNLKSLCDTTESFLKFLTLKHSKPSIFHNNSCDNKDRDQRSTKKNY